MSELPCVSGFCGGGGWRALTCNTFGRHPSVYYAHATAEDEVIFKEVNSVVPGATAVMDAEHHRDEADMQLLLSMCKGLDAGAPTMPGVPEVEPRADADVAAGAFCRACGFTHHALR